MSGTIIGDPEIRQRLVRIEQMTAAARRRLQYSKRGRRIRAAILVAGCFSSGAAIGAAFRRLTGG
jgi:hypothetical protein